MKKEYAVIPALIILVLFGLTILILELVSDNKKTNPIDECSSRDGYYWNAKLSSCVKEKEISEEFVKEYYYVAETHIEQEYSPSSISLMDYSKLDCENCYLFEFWVDGRVIVVSTLDKIISNYYEDMKEKNICREPRPEICTMEYAPVCGIFDETINCVKAPCGITFSNGCIACSNENIKYWISGECP